LIFPAVSGTLFPFRRSERSKRLFMAAPFRQSPPVSPFVAFSSAGINAILGMTLVLE
jgi:hypothetical protein